MRILIIDDSRSSLALLASVVGALPDVEIATRANPLEGLALCATEQFDLVLFMGVLYHLRHPLLALDLIHQHVARDILVFQAMQRGSDAIEPIASDYPFEEKAIFKRPGFPRLYFVEQQYSDKKTLVIF